MNRRRFLSGLGVLVAAPAIVRAEWLMPIKDMRPRVYFDGVRDDWPGLQAWIDGGDLIDRYGRELPGVCGQAIRLSKSLTLHGLFGGVITNSHITMIGNSKTWLKIE